MRQEHFAKQVGGILVAGDTGRYLVSVGDVGRQLYFETMVVETVGHSIGHFRQFQVVGGDDARHGEGGNLLQEKARTVQFVERVGAFQYFIKDNQCAGRPPAALHELFQAQQFCVEIGDAVVEVVGGAHAGEQRKHGNSEPIGKYGQPVDSQKIVYADGAQEGTLAGHVGSGDDVVVPVVDAEIVAHGFFA